MKECVSKKRITGYIGIAIVLVGVIVMGVTYGEDDRIQRQLAGKVIRFHVLANSDLEKDQQLKLLVRDAVGNYMHEKMTGISDRESCENVITQSLPEIIDVAEQVIWEEGYSYEVQAALMECDFPVKSYGAYTFPAGEYEALRITIGAGEGANWWCVMYPNMCFENSMYKVDEKTGEILREVLSEEEYEAVLSGGTYQVRFKLWEKLKGIF